tara:strand:- start:855 stop:1289 length:435 start_codon:yes stop_codon:yes gene_type:complete
MEPVQDLQALKAKAQANVEAVQLFTTLLHNISVNNDFNQAVSSALKDLNIENLNTEEYQSLYFDYMLLLIKQNLNYLDTKAFVNYIVDTFRENDWGRVRSKNYPSFTIHESTFAELEKVLIKINKAINKAFKEKATTKETPDAF